MDKDHALNQLRAAFPKTAIDSRGAFLPWGATYLDAEEFMRQLEGKTWDELDRNYLALRSDALGFLGTSHLISVLPAYMMALVEGLTPLSSLPGILLLILTKPDAASDGGLGKERFDALIADLSEEQRDAIAAALVYFEQTHGERRMAEAARQAVAAFWRKHLKV